jgi:hypothetical protein
MFVRRHGINRVTEPPAWQEPRTHGRLDFNWSARSRMTSVARYLPYYLEMTKSDDLNFAAGFQSRSDGVESCSDSTSGCNSRHVSPVGDRIDELVPGHSTEPVPLLRINGHLLLQARRVLPKPPQFQ